MAFLKPIMVLNLDSCLGSPKPARKLSHMIHCFYSTVNVKLFLLVGL